LTRYLDADGAGEVVLEASAVVGVGLGGLERLDLCLQFRDLPCPLKNGYKSRGLRAVF
jgi:hypothetical protein